MKEAEKSRYFPDAFDWYELPQACTRCRHPLHMMAAQDVPFCPMCAIDCRNAQKGRALLAMAKAKLRRLQAQDGGNASRRILVPQRNKQYNALHKGDL